MAAMPRVLVIGGLVTAGVVLLAVVLLAAVLVLRQERLMYFPTRRLAAAPASFGLDAAELAIVTEDRVRLHGWWIRGDGRRVLLYFHGNAGNVADRLDRARELHARFGLDIFLVDWRGYGRSEGSPSEEGLRRDGRAIYRTAIESGFRPEQIVLFGESLGTAMAIDLASKWACAGVVLETPFLSARALARVHYPWIPLPLVKNAYDNEASVARIPVPKLFLVAGSDEVAPAAQGRRLFETAEGVRELVVIPGAHHNDISIVGGDTYWGAWARFLSALR